MKLLILFLPVLVACGATQTIEKPIDRPIYCAKPPDKITYTSEAIIKNEHIEDKVIKLLIDRRERMNMEEELRAELKGCQKPE